MAREQDRQTELAMRMGRKWREKPNAVRQGNAVRDQVRVNTPAPGIVHTRIQRPPEPSVGGRPGEIMKHMAVGDTYDRLRVEQGAGNGGVKVIPPPKYGQDRTQSPSTLANGLTANTAVINGGFFGPDPNTPEYGKPVGPTKDREDALPIQEAYRGDYRTLNVGDEAGVSSGPILEPSQGMNTFEDARFKYDSRNEVQYSDAGSLTHAEHKNPRAAISIFPPKKQVPGDVIMHALTTGNAPRATAQGARRGATMREWQDITTQGSYQYKPGKKGKGKIQERKRKGRPSTLNLDGGGSVYMGVTSDNGQINQIASERPDPTAVPDIIFAGGGQKNEGKKISIENKRAPGSCNVM